jgi:5-methylcytosine-specific restriction protein A
MSPSSPTSLCRDCTRRAVANGYCDSHQTSNAKKTHKRLYDRYREDDPIRALYRCKRWQATRRIVLNRDILCRSCGHEVATECDHILSARLVHDNFGIDEFYNPERCQGLCHTCHSKKTALECGWSGRKGTKLTELGDRRHTTVVCGQACSGKTTYVAAHKGANDLVWDYDYIMAEITGLPLHQSMPDAIGSVLANRDAWIQATEYCPHHCWLIVSNPTAVIVTMMRDAGATVVVMDTADDVCQQRLRARFIADNRR